MEKFKICPICGEKNSPISFECDFCETDLTSVRTLDEATEKTLAGKQNETQNNESVTFRICDCGVKNPPNARKCSYCTEDISDILPTADTADKINYILGSIDSEYAFEINEQSITIGRDQCMKEYLCNKSFVSRTHAEISIENNMMLIKNLSGTNFTYVNNKKIALGEQVELVDGDELGLGGFVKNGERQSQAAYFQVRIGSCM